MCDWSNGGTPVAAPEWLGRPTVCIDPCIADAIQALWRAGHVTLSCCCGHGVAAPSVVVSDDTDARALADIVAILEGCDDRLWIVSKWVRCDVAFANTAKLKSKGGA